MRTEDRQATPTRIQLSAGQSHSMWTARDTVLFVQSGCIRLRESPEWMSETILKTLSTLQDGQHYQIERSGWTCLHATKSAEVLCYAGIKPRYFSLDFITRLLRAPTRRLRTIAAQLMASK
ncbi:hypothetical protein [Herbaspirillum rhizosphaerae]|uniref:hypothetical protein n=1 Tax=Herbaspirillum rhizosphaerae TaxID=346179 RepID=UPI00067C2E7F|nr:hypothetical protein [Herbaspirillum rhizosphaerae]